MKYQEYLFIFIHFFLWVLLQVFNTKNIITLRLVMGKVISTPTFTSSVSTSNALQLPQNCLKTTSKLPQNFWIPSDPPFERFSR